jgi:class 3 adenylate cyclase
MLRTRRVRRGALAHWLARANCRYPHATGGTAPPRAIQAAVAIQRALREHRGHHGFSPRVRIGAHRAEATVRGHDYAGHGVHAAARIGALGAAAEIAVRRTTIADGVVGFPISSPRTVTLPGVRQPVEIVTIDWR